ncbi:MAG: DsbC family protein [Pseudomonadota bacterium]
MKYNTIRSLRVATAAAITTFCAATAGAAEGEAASTSEELSKNEQVAAALLARMPNFGEVEVKPSTIDNLYEVAVGGTSVYYMSGDARYVIQGDMIDLETRENVTELRRSGARLGLMSDLDPESTVVFTPAQDTPVEHEITVFTDIDCGYCRKLHQEIAQLNELGIAVRYALYPRSGPNSPSWNKAVQVFCADDRNTALTRAKAGVDVEAEVCETDAVNQGWTVGRSAGVTGTPAIVTASGYLIGGYLPAPQLKARLEQIAGGSEG